MLLPESMQTNHEHWGIAVGKNALWLGRSLRFRPALPAAGAAGCGRPW